MGHFVALILHGLLYMVNLFKKTEEPAHKADQWVCTKASEAKTYIQNSNIKERSLNWWQKIFIKGEKPSRKGFIPTTKPLPNMFGPMAEHYNLNPRTDYYKELWEDMKA